MDKPTQEQIERLWKWCGLTNDIHYWYTSDWKRIPDDPLLLDLNNIFKYAIPKLQNKGHNVELYAYEYKGFQATVYKDVFSRVGDSYEPFLEPITQCQDDDHALALFWAVYKAMERGQI